MTNKGLYRVLLLVGFTGATSVMATYLISSSRQSPSVPVQITPDVVALKSGDAVMISCEGVLNTGWVNENQHNQLRLDCIGGRTSSPTPRPSTLSTELQPSSSATPMSGSSSVSTTYPLPSPTHVSEPSDMPKPVGQTEGWQLIFWDEFTEDALDQSKWDTCYPWINHNNCNLADSNELELYQPNEVYLDGSGHLVMRTEKKTVDGFNYASGMVHTYDSFSFQYGYAEARLKLPAGKGIWPAFWMLPTNDGPWPDDEIDIMENLGHDPTTAYFTYHWPSNHTTVLSQHQYTGPDFSTDWHTFAVDWEPGFIIWYVDGVERARYSDASNITGKPMFVILNLAIGGWAGSPDDTTPFASYYWVDYVRVWQRVSH